MKKLNEMELPCEFFIIPHSSLLIPETFCTAYSHPCSHHVTLNLVFLLVAIAPSQCEMRGLDARNVMRIV